MRVGRVLVQMAALAGLSVFGSLQNGAAAPASGDLSSPDKCSATSVFTFAEAIDSSGRRSRLADADLASATDAWLSDTTQGRAFHYTVDKIDLQVVVPPARW